MLPLPRLWVLACLAVLCTCSPPPPEPSQGPRLPELELLETTEGATWEVSLAATGGTPPLSYSATSLPPGLSLEASTGLLRGQASAAGRYTLTLRVRDSLGLSDSRSYTVLVQPARPDAGTPDAGTPDAGTPDAGRPDGGTPDAGTPDAGRPDAGGPTLPFSAANWNVEWFGDPVEGPVDDALQLQNVRTVMAELGADFWALQEVVDTVDFEELKRQLPGYDGFVANDPVRVPGGGNWYSPDEQKLAVLFRSGVVSVRRAEVILTAYNFDFASRPPLRVDLRVSRNGTSVDVVAIVLHLKAFTTSEDYQRRQNASAALKSYLDSVLPTERVLVLGDWNDDVDRSTVRADGGYLDTPFRNFLNTPADWTFITQPLSQARRRSTVSSTEFIDHQLASNELAGRYVPDSVQVIQPLTIPSYGTTTSDHYPVLSQYELAP